MVESETRRSLFPNEARYQRDTGSGLQIHSPALPNSLWTACLSSALECFVFCFSKFPLQIEAGKNQSGSTSRKR